MSTLICGSIAYDTIMVFPGEFKDHILPEKVHVLNVAFLVPEMRREFGGTAGNIAYNLHLLGGHALVMATVGQDCDTYIERMRKVGLNTDHVRRIPSAYTAQAFITTDRADNQITAFHPGAMSFSHENAVSDAGTGVRLGVVSPDGRQGMFAHAHEFKGAGIPFMFDPGQGMPMFTGDELMELIGLADYLAVNDYEAEMMCEKTGRSLTELAQQVRALIVTRGASGSEIYADGARFDIPCIAANKVVDPTGCGDAYRAGLLFGIERGLDWVTTGRIAALLGAIKIAHRGGQNHYFTPADIRSQFETLFGHAPW
jgi:adenosine kinase